MPARFGLFGWPTMLALAITVSILARFQQVRDALVGVRLARALVV